MRCLSRQDVDDALRDVPRGVRLGEYLVRSAEALGGATVRGPEFPRRNPVGQPADRDVNRLATRAFPRKSVRRWRVLPYRVAMGQLHVLTTEVPSEEMSRHLASLSGLAIRFRLVRPHDFNRMAAEYLGRPV